MKHVVLAVAAAICIVAVPAVAEDAAAAKIDGTPITMQELLQAAEPQLAPLKRQEYDILLGILDRMINERLMQTEAQRRGTTLDALIEEVIRTNSSRVTLEEVNEHYERNKEQINRPLEQISAALRNQLQRQRDGGHVIDFVAELRRKSKIDLLLEPPRTEVSVDDDPSLGPAGAPVTIIEFSDFQCPFCSQATATLKAIVKKYGDRVRLVFRDYPLAIHPQAYKAAEAAQCADEQGRFWDYHDLLFAGSSGMGIEALTGYAEALELDLQSFGDCLTSGKYTTEVSKDIADGQKAGVDATPSFFVNGRFAAGVLSLEAFSLLIDEELARQGIEPGAP